MQTLTLPTLENQQPTQAQAGAASEADALRTGEHARANILTPLSGTGNNAGYQKTTVTAGSLVDGKMVAEWVDAIIPALIIWIGEKAHKIYKKNDLLLSAKEKDTLAPILSKCLDDLMINFDSPWVALAVTAGFIYTGKIVTATAEKKTADKIEPNKATVKEPIRKPADDKLQKVAGDLERERAIRLKQEVDKWMPAEEDIIARGLSLRQSPRLDGVGRPKIIKSLRSQRYKELLDKKD